MIGADCVIMSLCFCRCRALSMQPVAVEIPLRSSVDPAALYAPTITGSKLSNGASLVARHSRADVSAPPFFPEPLFVFLCAPLVSSRILLLSLPSLPLYALSTLIPSLFPLFLTYHVFHIPSIYCRIIFVGFCRMYP